MDNVDKESMPVQSETKEGIIPFFTEIFKFVLLALIIVVPIRVYVAQPYIVSGDSMIPQFHNGDYLIVDQFSYRFLNEPARGEVIVFKYPNDPSKFFIKRIIALPRETMTIDRGSVTIHSEESSQEIVLNEPYINPPFTATMTITLGDDEYFVMGDNRNESLDSRSWGPLPKNLVVGRAFARLFPLTHISLFPGKILEENNSQPL